MIVCDACGAENPVQRFCGSCGLPLKTAEEAGRPHASEREIANADRPEAEVTDAAAPRKRRWVIVGVAGVAALALAAVLIVVLGDSGPSQEEQYLQDIQDAGLMGEFAADRAAIANATRICNELDGGAKPQGSEADRIGVEHYCVDYADAFKVLETERIEGTFTILDSDSAGFRDGGSCQGDGGYGDLNASTTVVVKNNSGDILARTELGSGTGDGVISCTFTFEFDLTEGEDQYVLLVGDRGEISYSWDEISRRGAVALTIG